MIVRHIAKRSRPIAIAIAGLILGYIIIMNTVPFKTQKQASLVPSHNMSSLVPSKRVIAQAEKIAKMVGDLIYFDVKSPFNYEVAKISLIFRNPDQNQTVSLGYRDQESWHYKTQIINAPFIDALTWPKVGQGPYLYQKSPTHQNPEAFVADPPKDKVIGVYNFDENLVGQRDITLPDYKPAAADTVIDTPLRGRVVMYVYLSGEPFRLSVEKRDLNWYDDPDPVDISIYKGAAKVLTSAIADDGNDSSDHRLGQPQSVELKNPGPGLPEAGVYKVVIDAPGDTVVTKITTNMHKLVFEGPLYPADNHEVYDALVPQTKPTALFTNVRGLSVQTNHQNFQPIFIGKKATQLNQAGAPLELDIGGATGTIVIPKSDVILNGIGYFAFSPEQFFEPSPYHIVQITGPGDIAKVDYVLTNYKPPKPLGDGWVQVEREFDLRDAVPQKGKLSWMISAPGLADNKRTIEIKDIEMTLTKEGWFKK